MSLNHHPASWSRPSYWFVAGGRDVDSTTEASLARDPTVHPGNLQADLFSLAIEIDRLDPLKLIICRFVSLKIKIDRLDPLKPISADLDICFH